MERYLVYDATCLACNQIAKTIQVSVGDKLEAISIYELKAKTLLDHAFPDVWSHVPYLVVVNHGKVRAWSGISAIIRLGQLLEPQKAWEVWKVAGHHNISAYVVPIA